MPVFGLDMPAYELKVNGSVRKVDVPADTPLLWVLRDALDLVGTKFGCGMSQCGACTVHLNGDAVRSCTMRVTAAVSGTIVTIEGLSPDGSHPLQRAWIKYDVPQCGYCQAGQIMTAAALLARNNKPTDTEIDEALTGNICRCGTYPRIRRAVREAAAAMRGEKLTDTGVDVTAGLASMPSCCHEEVRA